MSFFNALEKAVKKSDSKIKLEREVKTLRKEEVEKYFK